MCLWSTSLKRKKRQKEEEEERMTRIKASFSFEKSSFELRLIQQAYSVFQLAHSASLVVDFVVGIVAQHLQYA